MGPHLQASPATRHVRRLTARALAWTCVAITTNVATKHHAARSTKAAMACHQPASARSSHWLTRPPPPPTHDYNPKISTGTDKVANASIHTTNRSRCCEATAVPWMRSICVCKEQLCSQHPLMHLVAVL